MGNWSHRDTGKTSLKDNVPQHLSALLSLLLSWVQLGATDTGRQKKQTIPYPTAGLPHLKPLQHLSAAHQVPHPACAHLHP